MWAPHYRTCFRKNLAWLQPSPILAWPQLWLGHKQNAILITQIWYYPNFGHDQYLVRPPGV